MAHFRSRGWTIIELVTVLAVLAVLAGILFPLLGRSRQISYKAQCANNMRQLFAAFSQYSNDWSGYWPGPGGLKGDLTYWSQTGHGGLESYINQRGTKTVWCCPLVPEWTGPFPPRSYSMNSYLRTTPLNQVIEYPDCVTYPLCLTCQRGINVSRIQQPGRTILLYEGMPLTDGTRETLDYLYRCANWSKVRGFINKVANTIDPGNPWHGRLNNYLYCDGHIVARRPGKLTVATNVYGFSTGKEMYEWYIDKGEYMQWWNDGKRFRGAPWQ